MHGWYYFIINFINSCINVELLIVNKVLSFSKVRDFLKSSLDSPHKEVVKVASEAIGLIF
jgi:hypothetical protein